MSAVSSVAQAGSIQAGNGTNLKKKKKAASTFPRAVSVAGAAATPAKVKKAFSKSADVAAATAKAALATGAAAVEKISLPPKASPGSNPSGYLQSPRPPKPSAAAESGGGPAMAPLALPAAAAGPAASLTMQFRALSMGPDGARTAPPRSLTPLTNGAQLLAATSFFTRPVLGAAACAAPQQPAAQERNGIRIEPSNAVQAAAIVVPALPNAQDRRALYDKLDALITNLLSRVDEINSALVKIGKKLLKGEAVPATLKEQSFNPTQRKALNELCNLLIPALKNNIRKQKEYYDNKKEIKEKIKLLNEAKKVILDNLKFELVSIDENINRRTSIVRIEKQITTLGKEGAPNHQKIKNLHDTYLNILETEVFAKLPTIDAKKVATTKIPEYQAKLLIINRYLAMAQVELQKNIRWHEQTKDLTCFSPPNTYSAIYAANEEVCLRYVAKVLLLDDSWANVFRGFSTESIMDDMAVTVPNFSVAVSLQDRVCLPLKNLSTNALRQFQRFLQGNPYRAELVLEGYSKEEQPIIQETVQELRSLQPSENRDIRLLPQSAQDELHNFLENCVERANPALAKSIAVVGLRPELFDDYIHLYRHIFQKTPHENYYLTALKSFVAEEIASRR